MKDIFFFPIYLNVSGPRLLLARNLPHTVVFPFHRVSSDIFNKCTTILISGDWGHSRWTLDKEICVSDPSDIRLHSDCWVITVSELTDIRFFWRCSDAKKKKNSIPPRTAKMILLFPAPLTNAVLLLRNFSLFAVNSAALSNFSSWLKSRPSAFLISWTDRSSFLAAVPLLRHPNVVCLSSISDTETSAFSFFCSVSVCSPSSSHSLKCPAGTHIP